MKSWGSASLFRPSCRVDAVDFEDSGDEGGGDYELIEDPDSGEKYKCVGAARGISA